MSSDPQPAARQSADRWQTIEERLSFQQHGLDQLHEALLAQQQELAALRRELRTWAARWAALAEGGDDLPHEKPPHY
jgi:uncharacterized coiled-coil protein SlyX